jgi:hypothetical protein
MTFARIPFSLLLLALTSSSLTAAEPTPQELFEKRLLPIFKSPNPSSCVQCHLAGVDLKDYILPDHEKTFRSLRDQGLIDLEQPEKSKILRLIQMGAGDRKDSALIHAKTRKAEYEAFSAWIKSCCSDEKLVKSPPLDADQRGKPSRPVEVIRHARKDRLLESFESNVWSMRFRCMNCHTQGTPQAEKHVKKHGERIAWFRRGGPEATMEFILAGKLIDLKNPEKSLLLRKPLGEVEHEGGIKIQSGDDGYRSIRSWIEDVAAIRAGKYVKAADLPKESGRRFASQIWLKLTDTPPAWADRLLQVSVFAWDPDAKKWESRPIAVSDRKVFGKGKLWQHNLTLLAEDGSERAKRWGKGKPSLPAGTYLIRVHVDAKDRLARDWKAVLGDGEYVGQAELKSAWLEGYGAMTVLDARKVSPRKRE